MTRALQLSDGPVEVIDIQALYEALWGLSVSRRGAVTAAAKILSADSEHRAAIRTTFDELESADIREALRDVSQPPPQLH